MTMCLITCIITAHAVFHFVFTNSSITSKMIYFVDTIVRMLPLCYSVLLTYNVIHVMHIFVHIWHWPTVYTFLTKYYFAIGLLMVILDCLSVCLYWQNFCVIFVPPC